MTYFLSLKVYSVHRVDRGLEKGEGGSWANICEYPAFLQEKDGRARMVGAQELGTLVWRENVGGQWHRFCDCSHLLTEQSSVRLA